MGKLWLIFLTLAFSVLFLIYRPTGTIGFWMSPIVLSSDTYVYFLYEHVGIILFAWIMLEMSVEKRYLYLLFLLISVVDLFFFLAYYKSPFPWNPLKCALFGVPLIYETWKHYRQP